MVKRKQFQGVLIGDVLVMIREVQGKIVSLAIKAPRDKYVKRIELEEIKKNEARD